MASDTATITVNVKMSLWQAIKIRVSGIFKNTETYEQVGNCIKIKYKGDK
jgi:hypothetical protein